MRSSLSGPAAEALAIIGKPQERPSNGAAGEPDKPDTLEVQNEAVQPGTSTRAQPPDDDAHSWIVLSAFVNLREGPSSSRQVIGVMDRGSKLRIIGRKRAWLKVSDAASSQTGWIYSRYAASVTKPRRAVSKAPSMLSASGAEPGSDDSMWTRLGRWAIGP